MPVERWKAATIVISIHALLAESDQSRLIPRKSHRYFYPRSPCGERQSLQQYNIAAHCNFYPRSPCGERQSIGTLRTVSVKISIHALLAESDRAPPYNLMIHQGFLSTLSLRRATGWTLNINGPMAISIHALLAESDGRFRAIQHSQINISIHALLAESDNSRTNHIKRHEDFYPRSPCGERQQIGITPYTLQLISIHALLAESDIMILQHGQMLIYFYPRSPCGERLSNVQQFYTVQVISIHALLAESDTLDTYNLI